MITRTVHKGYDGLLDFPLQRVPENAQGMVSVRPGNPHNVPPPIRPGDEGWDENVEEFLKVRSYVESNDWPSWYLEKGNPSGSDGGVPKLLAPWVSKYRVSTAEKLVDMDEAPNLGIALYNELVKEGVPFDEEFGFIPFVEHKIPCFVKLMLAIEESLNIAFDSKNYYGLDRPEEHLNLPPRIITGSATGCPPHKSYCAGHGAIFGSTYSVLASTFNFENHQQLLLDLIDATWQASHYRTLLGVHWRQDNDAGYYIHAEMPEIPALAA